MSGQGFSFSEADLRATVTAYDPAKHEAPLVVGHPSHDLPAYGWVKSLAFSDGALDAIPAQVNPDFAEMVAAGAFKKISATFYGPDSPSNPVPGVFYLRHVGFLGAQPPAVKGLRSPSFADGEEGVLTFSEWDDVQNAGLWRNLREWFIGKFGQEEADKVIPGYQVQSLEQGAQDELRQTATQNTPAFSEPTVSTVKETTVTPEEKAALEAENTRLKTELAQFSENAKRERTSAFVSFAEAQIGKGLLPAEKDAAVAVLNMVADAPSVAFAEGGATKTVSAVDFVKALIERAKPAVHFGEHAAGGLPATGTAAGLSEAEIDSRAKAYSAQHKLSYAEALTAVTTVTS